MDDEKKKEVVYDIHKEVVKVANGFKKVTDDFFATEIPNLTHNKKFLVINRAISINSKMWFDHFVREFDPENKAQ